MANNHTSFLARPKGLEPAKGDFKLYYLMLSNAAEVLRRKHFRKMLVYVLLERVDRFYRGKGQNKGQIIISQSY